jgi:hypothetical protein
MPLQSGKSRWAHRRRQRAAELGILFAAGNVDAAMRLSQRGAALIGIAKYGPMYRIAAMVAGARAARERRKQQQERQLRADQRRQQSEKEALYLKIQAFVNAPLSDVPVQARASVRAARQRELDNMLAKGVIVKPVR